MARQYAAVLVLKLETCAEPAQNLRTGANDPRTDLNFMVERGAELT